MMIAGPSMRSPGARSRAVIDRRRRAGAAVPHMRTRRARRERPAVARRRQHRILRPSRSRRSPRPRPLRRSAPSPARRSRSAGDGPPRSAATISRAAAEGDDQRRVGALVAQMRRDGSTAMCDSAMPWPRHLAPGLRLRARRARPSSAPMPPSVEPRLDRALAQHAHVGEAHAIGRQHAGQRMQEDARHAERVGDEAGMLAAGAAEAAERILGHVVAALDRDLLDRVRHVLDGDAAGSPRPPASGVRRVAGRGRDLARPARRTSSRTTAAIERLIAVRPEDAREEIRLDACPSITLQSVTVSGPPRR